MARNQHVIDCPPNVWTQITDGDATNITFQILNGAGFVRYTTDGTAPAATLKGALYVEAQGEVDKPIADLVALANAARVWVRGVNGSAEVYVDHA